MQLEIGNVTLVDQLSLDKPLTTTEIETLQAVDDGDRSADVAVRRGIAVAVKNCIWRVCQKLGADSRAHAVAVAFRAGLIK
jgi:DNA-binding NarL/FixJ family response regulator